MPLAWRTTRRPTLKPGRRSPAVDGCPARFGAGEAVGSSARVQLRYVELCRPGGCPSGRGGGTGDRLAAATPPGQRRIGWRRLGWRWTERAGNGLAATGLAAARAAGRVLAALWPGPQNRDQAAAAPSGQNVRRPRHVLPTGRPATLGGHLGPMHVLGTGTGAFDVADIALDKSATPRPPFFDGYRANPAPRGEEPFPRTAGRSGCRGSPAPAPTHAFPQAVPKAGKEQMGLIAGAGMHTLHKSGLGGRGSCSVLNG